MHSGGSRGDEIGKRGEAIFQLLVTKLDGRPTPLFRADFLGGTFPGVDFMVTLVGFEGFAPFFFAQVKATRSGYRRDGRLQTRRVTKKGLHAIARYPVPTYLFGIDEPGERGYLLAAGSGPITPLNGFPTTYPINEENRSVLWREVKRYWRNPRRLRSKFVDPGRSE